MVKKLKEYKPGDFIFAKVKGYPAWPARVKGVNGKKYFVFFYGTGETANLASNVLFDYVDNKEKFLAKPIKRKDFNEGVAQIEYDISNNVQLDENQIVPPSDISTNDTLNETADTTADVTADSAFDESVAETTAADTSTAKADESTTSAAPAPEPAPAPAPVPNEPVEDSDEGHLVIDESKTKPAAAIKRGRPPKVRDPVDASTPKKEKEPKASRKSKEPQSPAAPVEEEKKEEIVSRSGRKIKPKRFTDAITEDAEMSPALQPPKKRRATTPPAPASSAAPSADKREPKEKKVEPAAKQLKLNFINQNDLEDLKEPYNDGKKSTRSCCVV